MNCPSARSIRARPPFSTVNREPDSFAARSKSIMPSASPVAARRAPAVERPDRRHAELLPSAERGCFGLWRIHLISRVVRPPAGKICPKREQRFGRQRHAKNKTEGRAGTERRKRRAA